MSTHEPRVTNAWNLFTYINFGIAAAMMAGGIWALEASFSAKGFYAMAAIMLVYSTAGISKSLRDKEEAQREFNKIELAKTERLLAEGAKVEDA